MQKMRPGDKRAMAVVMVVVFGTVIHFYFIYQTAKIKYQNDRLKCKIISYL